MIKAGIWHLLSKVENYSKNHHTQGDINIMEILRKRSFRLNLLCLWIMTAWFTPILMIRKAGDVYYDILLGQNVDKLLI